MNDFSLTKFPGNFRKEEFFGLTAEEQISYLKKWWHSEPELTKSLILDPQNSGFTSSQKASLKILIEIIEAAMKIPIDEPISFEAASTFLSKLTLKIPYWQPEHASTKGVEPGRTLLAQLSGSLLTKPERLDGVLKVMGILKGGELIPLWVTGYLENGYVSRILDRQLV